MYKNNSIVVPADESTTRRARNNNLTSRVWDHFELQRRPSVGSSEETYKAVCKKCGQIMSFDPKQATTTHLLRHIERNICSMRAAASARRRQQQQQQQEDEVVVAAPAAANDDSQAAKEAFADGVWADWDDDHA